VDDLPIWGFVGEASEGGGEDAAAVYVYTHRSFDISYNGDNIIQVNLTSESPAALVVGTPLAFTYSVTWHASRTRFAQRFERYLDYNFFEHQIHAFSIFNSFMMVIFLTGLVSMILMRTLRNDYARYATADDDGEGGSGGGLDALERSGGGGGEESGWKLVHGDVFRPPRRLALLAALLGTGAQLALLALTVTLVTIAGALFEGRGAIATATIVAYALTSALAGYVSGGFNARHGGRAWIRAMLLTAGLFPGGVALIAAALNTIAIAYHSLAAVPFGTIVLVTAIWAFVSGPLVLLGTVLGRNWAGAPNYPCRVKSIPRPIPACAWYASPPAVALLGGLLPFGSIFIELYFTLTSMWGYKIGASRVLASACLFCRMATRLSPVCSVHSWLACRRAAHRMSRTRR
jgi:transmembrane 9 superfamily protein 3